MVLQRRILGPVMAALLMTAGVTAPGALAGPTGSPQIVASGLSTPWEIVLVPGVPGAPAERTGSGRAP